MAVISCTVIGRVAWNHDYAGGCATQTRRPAAITELAFKAVKSGEKQFELSDNLPEQRESVKVVLRKRCLC